VQAPTKYETLVNAKSAKAINLDVIGLVLIGVGTVGFILTMFFWESWWGPGYFRRTRYASAPGYDYGPPPWRGCRASFIVEQHSLV